MLKIILNWLPQKRWMIVWGSAFVVHKPRAEKLWFVFGEPIDMGISGCGPFDDDKINDALRRFNGESETA